MPVLVPSTPLLGLRFPVYPVLLVSLLLRLLTLLLSALLLLLLLLPPLPLLVLLFLPVLLLLRQLPTSLLLFLMLILLRRRRQRLPRLTLLLPLPLLLLRPSGLGKEWLPVRCIRQGPVCNGRERAGYSRQIAQISLCNPSIGFMCPLNPPFLATRVPHLAHVPIQCICGIPFPCHSNPYLALKQTCSFA